MMFGSLCLGNELRSEYKSKYCLNTAHMSDYMTITKNWCREKKTSEKMSILII